jgi:hypothetical protein
MRLNVLAYLVRHYTDLSYKIKDGRTDTVLVE